MLSILLSLLYNTLMRNAHTNKGYKLYPIDLTAVFSDVAYRLVDTDPQYIGYHYHDGYEIMQIWSDCGTALIGGSIFPFQAGSLYLFNANGPHCTNPARGQPYMRSKLAFSPALLSSILPATDSLHLLKLFSGKSAHCMVALSEEDARRFDTMFSSLYDEYVHKRAGYKLGMTGTLLMLLNEIARLGANPAEHARYTNDAVRFIMEYIHAHATENLTMNDICTAVHFSKYYLCHIYKEQTGVTVMQYLAERRVHHAKQMLSDSRFSISEIAFRSGFNGFSQFSRLFKRYTGLSPRQYRKRN